jgi:aldehyde dehydrogenase (NAD+)
MNPKSVSTNILNFPSNSYILHEPLGVVLIIGPWNYPINLLFTPLIGAIAAGNCAVMKPSELAPATANLLERITQEIFPPEYIKVINGQGKVVVPQMLSNFRFDHVFYTGSTQVGKIIYELAAKQLTPVTLELGGKSPCIIESDADIKVAAKRIALTKFINAGQMCVAPDYLLVHEHVKQKFIDELKLVIEKFYSKTNQQEHYGKIVDLMHFNRLVQYIKEGEIIFGGGFDEKSLLIEPTLIQNMPPGASIMQEEIFGPVLPILSFTEDKEVYEIIERNKDPLSLYVFSSSKQKSKKWMHSIASGGGCINNASWQLTNHHLPFGGRGDSGFGKYHGRFSFDTFSHQKAVMNTPTWFDPSIKYPPFNGKLNLFKRFIR